MKYWIAVDGQGRGPYELDYLTSNNLLKSDTLVWREGMPQWVAASQLPELQSLFAPSAVPQPPYLSGVDSSQQNLEPQQSVEQQYSETAADTNHQYQAYGQQNDPQPRQEYDEYDDYDYPRSYLALSITLTAVSLIVYFICAVISVGTTAWICPYLLGAPAIVMSAFVKVYTKRKNYDRAYVFSKKARFFNIMCGIFLGLMVTLTIIIAATYSAMAASYSAWDTPDFYY